MWDFLPFSSSRFSFKLFALLIICLSFGPLSLSNAIAAPKKIYALAGTTTEDPIPPCTTSGFAVDGTMNFIRNAAHVTRFHRIDRENTGSKIGYVITTDGVTNERWIITYDGRSMAQIARRQMQLPGDLDYGITNLAGEIYNGTLYLFRLVNLGRLGCAVANCVSLSKWDFNGRLLGETIVAVATSNLDDARLNGPSTLMLLYNNGAQRAIALYSIPGGTFISNTAGLGVAAPGQFALNADSGFQYIAYDDAAKTIQRISPGGSSVLNSSNWAFAGLNIMGAMMVMSLPQLTPVYYLAGYSSTVGGIPANENYRSATTLADLGTLFQFIVGDGNATKANTFWDVVNLKTYSFRSSGQILRLPPFNPIIEQRYTCPTAFTCDTSTNPTADFVLRNGRLYNAADTAANIGTVTRVQVCATGGPPP